jgi:hypothetical protein
MKKFTQLTAAFAMVVLVAAPALADTLYLKSGARITGYFEGGTARVVKFKGADGITKDYDILQVQQVLFGETPATPPANNVSNVAPSSAPVNSTTPQLRSPADRPSTQAPAAAAANTAYTIPTGTKITIQTVDVINSETSRLGSTFVATLDEPILLNGVQVAAKGADVRGRIANVSDAGRVTGSAQLGLELTQIYVNGIPYAVTTSEYQEVGESRTGQTARRAGVGAGVGAVIGAIAGGGRGAAIGAGVGAGAGTAVQVMTKGEKLNIPAETKLEFTLRAPLVIAAR